MVGKTINHEKCNYKLINTVEINIQAMHRDISPSNFGKWLSDFGEIHLRRTNNSNHYVGMPKHGTSSYWAL